VQKHILYMQQYMYKFTINVLVTYSSSIYCDIQQQYFTAPLPGSVALYNHEEDILGLYKYVNC
jgi:hypothetical protein